MAGAPSQLELFDYKPELMKLHGAGLSAIVAGRQNGLRFIRGVPKMLGPQAAFKQHGEIAGPGSRRTCRTLLLLRMKYCF